MEIYSYKELEKDASLLTIVKNADASKLQIGVGPHWVEAIVARYPSRKRRGVCFFLYVRSLSDGEIYRIAITLAHCAREYDRLLRQHPEGAVYRIDTELKKSGNIALHTVEHLCTPLKSSVEDRLLAELTHDWCQTTCSRWYRIPLIRKVFSESGYELLILCKRPKLMLEENDFEQKAFGIGSLDALVRVLLDWSKYIKVVEQLYSERSFREPLIGLHSVLSMVPDADSPNADAAILAGEVIGYRKERAELSKFNVTYAFIDSEPRRGGEKANRGSDKSDAEISQRILLALVTVLKPRIIVTSGHDVARQVPKIFEPLLADSKPIKLQPFRRARRNRLWVLHELVGTKISKISIIPQVLKTRQRPTFFMPILDGGYWGKRHIHKASVPDGYWASIVRFFQGRIGRSKRAGSR